jgi:tmRNA-binding protein
MSDAELTALDRRDWQPYTLDLRGTKITDDSLPILERLQPAGIVLAGTQVSAQALMKANLSNSEIVVEYDQFTVAEFEMLHSKLKITRSTISPNAEDW